jgi:hypothetical protein
MNAGKETLIRLLSFYLIPIARKLQILGSECSEIELIDTSHAQWNKAGRYTWSQISYVGQKDKTPSSNAHGTQDEFDFVENSDLTKCAVCGEFWAFLSADGLCINCQNVRAVGLLEGWPTVTMADRAGPINNNPSQIQKPIRIIESVLEVQQSQTKGILVGIQEQLPQIQQLTDELWIRTSSFATCSDGLFHLGSSLTSPASPGLQYFFMCPLLI